MLSPKDGLALVKTVRHYAARIRRDGSGCSERDAQLLAEVVVSRAYLLLDLTYGPHCAEGYWRAIMSIPTLDAKLYAESVKALRDYVVASMATYTHGAFEDLVHRFKPGAGGIHYRWMVTPLLHFEREGGDEAGILSRALQWASYDTKLNMRDVDFSEELCLEYLHDEYVMSRYTYDCGLIAALRDVVTEWSLKMSTIPETAPWHFRHGNGATVEVPRAKASLLKKDEHFTLTSDDVAYFSWRGASEDLDFRAFTIAPRLAEEQPIIVDFVPKSPLTNRVISKEHVTKMWVQNDLFWLMDRMFRESGVPVHLHNQEMSRQMALEGSSDGRYETFDYSKASDFVTNSIVSQITRGTWLHDPLQWSRSKSVVVGRATKWRSGLSRFSSIYASDDVTIPLAKFAPMGSSTCFPTESLVFAALCEVAVRRTLHRKSRPGDYLVYGDDVVIRRESSDELRFLSSLMHFKVNDGKTCRGAGSHIYREACGIEAIDGRDTTPLRVSRRYVGVVNLLGCDDTTPGEALGVIDFVNRCYLHGLANLRKYFDGMLALWPKFHQILRVGATDFATARERWRTGEGAAIQLPTPYFLTDDDSCTNYKCRCRCDMGASTSSHCGCYQTPEVKVWTVIAREDREKTRVYWRDDPKDVAYNDAWWAYTSQDVKYYHWLLQAQQWDRCSRDDRDFLSDVERRATTGSSSLMWVKRWIHLF